jgi:paraquat-inducible protein A
MPHSPFDRGHARAAAFAIAATIMLVPANVLPVVTTQLPGQSRSATIFSGIRELWESGSWITAGIVFTASFLVPFLKIGGLGVLLVAARRGPGRYAKAFQRLHAGLTAIGRWSMLDVFLAAFLTSAVQFGAIATVAARAGIIAFAAAVVLTILATRAFDPRSLQEDNPIRAKECLS